MKKEPLFLTLLKWFLIAMFLFFMAMNYWSSLLIEEDLRQLKNELLILKQVKKTAQRNQAIKNVADHNFEYPNLLQDDPFYATMLPKILPADFQPKGTLNAGMVAKPENLHPFSSFVDPVTLNDLCTISLGKNHFGQFEKLGPSLAERMELRKDENGRPVFWIFLRNDVFWHPLKEELFSNAVKLSDHFLEIHPVTAHDVKFYYDAFMNPYVQENLAVALRLYYSDIEEFKVIDDYTLTVKWKVKEEIDASGNKIYKHKYKAKELTADLKPLPSFVFQYFPDGSKIIENDMASDAYKTNPVWAQNFNQHWAKNVIPSCGAWTFENFTDRDIRIVRNSDFFDPYAALVEERQYTIKNSADSLWESFKAGETDYLGIQPHQLSELARFMESKLYQQQAQNGKAIKQLDYIYRAYIYIGWNLNKPLFKEKKIRQALTMAIDRQRIIKQMLNGMGEQITGPFVPSSPSYNKSLQPYPFDPHRAKELFKEEGWIDHDGDGIVDKIIDGQSVPFKFTLTYFVKNPTTKAVCEYVATSLKEIGIACLLNGVDTADLSATMNDRSFDAFAMGWALGTPPEEPKQLWYSSGKNEKGSSNYVSFANEEADKIMDQLEYEDNQEKRNALYHRFHEIIYDEQPYTFLYVPKISMIYREYVQNVFLPSERKDLIPEATVSEPQSNIFWIKSKT